MRKFILSPQSGVILTIFPAILAVFLILVGLVIGLGTLLNATARVQNSANLAAYAGLEAYNRDADLSVEEKLTNTKKAIDNILEKNTVAFMDGNFKPTEVWDGSDVGDSPMIKLGFWFGESPSNCSEIPDDVYTGCKCPNQKSCFIPIPKSALANLKQTPNAIKIQVNLPSNSLSLPLAKLVVNNDKADFSTTAIAQAVERCSVFLLDVSSSAFEDSHKHYTSEHWMEPIDFDNPEHIPPPPYTTRANSPFPNLDRSHYCNDEGALYKRNQVKWWGSFWSLPTPFPDWPSHTAPMYQLRSINKNLPIIYPYLGLPPGTYSILAPPSGNMNDYDCSKPLTYCNAGNAEKALRFEYHAQWCAMDKIRPEWCWPGKTYYDDETECARHYRSDFEVEETLDGKYAIDKMHQPEPMRSFMMAINGGLRELQSKSTSIDKVALLPFSNQLHGPVPYEGLTTDLRFPIDLTDMRRGGQMIGNDIDDMSIEHKHHPNFIDRNWFPTKNTVLNSPKSESDILMALNKAIERLTNPAYCSSEGIKSIIIATDGIMTMTYNKSGSAINWNNGGRQIKNWNDQLEAESVLLDRDYPNSILKRLVDAKIRVTTLLTGQSIQPNFANELKSHGPPKVYLSLQELGAKGFRGFPDSSTTPPERSFTNNSPEIPSRGPDFMMVDADGNPTPCNSTSPNYNLDECARRFSSKGIDGLIFRRPNGLFSQLSVLSGGLFCPIMEPYRNSDGTINSGCYDSDTHHWKDGDPNCQRDQPFQQLSVIGLEKGGQAAECLQVALGRPPFALTAEVTAESSANTR